MTPREPVVVGLSVSLSGPLRRQGQDAYDGIQLWVEHVVTAENLPLRLVALDDASRVSRARANVTRLLSEERVDLLLGPYGSGSTLAAARVAAAHGKILWNHDRVRTVSFDTPLRDAKALLGASLADRPDLLVVAGQFEDDIAIIRQREMLETIGTTACVAAGVDAFHQELGVLAEGVIGPSQWEPHLFERPSLGPSSAWFLSEFRR